MPVWRVEIRDQHDESHDAFVDGEAGTTTEALLSELDGAGFHARPIGVNGVSLSSVETLGELEMAHGDVIQCGRLERPAASPGAGRHLVVVCGPGAGTSLPLPADGSVVIGRAAQADLVLADDLVSSEHVRIDVRDSVVTAVDLGSTNGTTVEGTEIDEPTELHHGSYLQAGSSVLTVVDVLPSDLAVLGEPDGPDRVIPRQYRRPHPPLPRKIDAPKEPSDAKPRQDTGMWWRAVLPVITGIGMAMLTGRWEFLAFTILSPLSMAADAFRRKRLRGRTQHEAQERYQQELVTFRERVATVRGVERNRRRDVSQCGGISVLVARARHQRLWERAPGDPDYLSVAVGLGPVPSEILAEDPEDPIDPSQWGVPVETDLLQTGSLSIVGDVQRARAAARGVLVNLVATHSPSEVRLWLLSRDEDGAEWGFMRWLPHTFNGPQSSLIATNDSTRTTMIKALKQLIDTRAELDDGRSDAPPLPSQVVVIDGVDLLEPGELTDLLRRGPKVGVAAIVVDPRVTPEGVGASLVLGNAADLATFDSRHRPRIEGIIVAEVEPAVAEGAARRLAALRPSIDRDGGGVSGVYHLVDIDGLSGITAEQIVERWAHMSPHMTATVGMSGAGGAVTPMHVDLVKDGPHGLVGGTSGSGKTEFLKTLFLSLCLNNHPDDLAIVIVDFKGGVDHEAVRPLPHVVDVATNLDVEQFKRTIALLNAEQKRRQAILGSVGANNVVSYRAAREGRPDLPPLPRLLVVVDEFGELLAGDGREQLKELESITRIGRALGLHLLLVTQNFEGNLPAQIEANAGLRVSLRVQKPSHSKAVLDSGVAASIPDKNVGRAYARFHGRDLIEFQTARVAGRRRDLESVHAPADVRLSPFSTLGTPPPEQRVEDVPNEETDMYLLVERVREAATLSGWRQGAVPWPSALPSEVSAARLLRSFGDRTDATPIGVVDVPEAQRREPAVLTERDEQIAVIGGPSTPIPEVLTTYAATLAMTRPADDVHIYGIDLLGRSLAQLADLPHCGGIAVRNEQLALRIVRWLTQQAAERKVEIASSGSANVWEHAAVTGRMPPQLVLLVSGVDRMIAINESAGSNLVGPLSTLLSEGIGVRIQVVLAGLPRVVVHRLGMNIERRVVLQLPDPSEYVAVNAPKTFASELRVDRRAILLPDKRVVQLAQLSPHGAGDGAVLRALADTLAPATVHPPHRFADVPWPLAWEAAMAEPRVPPAAFVAPLPVAIDTNSGEWAWIDALDDGPVFAVAGPPKSGRSSALRSMAHLAVEQGWAVINATESRRSPLSGSPDPVLARRCAPGDLGAAVEATPGRVLVLIDDLQRLDDAAGITAALAAGDRVLIAVAAPPDFLSVRTGVMKAFPGITAGLLLAPSGALDGGAIGLRRIPAEWTGDPRPGRGIMAISGEALEAQLPLIVG